MRVIRCIFAVLLWTGPLAASSAETPDYGAGPAAWVGDATPLTPDEWTPARAAHLVERLAFGGPPDLVEQLASMSPSEAVRRLVHYQNGDDGEPAPFVESGIYPHGHKFKSITELAGEAMRTGRVLGIAARRDGLLPLQPGIDEFYTLLWSDFGEIHRAGQWWAQRMLTTPRPTEERLTLFWHDHFATSQEKVHRHRKMIDHIETLRRHANGNFRELLIAVSQDPAMLIWLDNRDNVKGSPNENYAREIMELFTMGEGNGYTEDDIKEVARAFTGWTITEDDTTAEGAGSFIDRKELHDDGEKAFLGKTGPFDGYDAIDIIVAHPATARYIVGKLAREFVRDQPDPVLVERWAQLFTEKDYEIAPVLEAMFLSRDFYSSASVGTMVKSPVDLVISTYRKLALEEIPGLPDFGAVTAELGQSLFLPPNVAGWPGHRTWINPATLLARGNFVETLLFPPDPTTWEPPDKDIHEGYRKIPVMFPNYQITPHIWNTKTQEMEPVPLVLYDKYLTGMRPQEVIAARDRGDAETMTMDGMSSGATMGESQMSKVAHGEQYNLAVGVYTGHVRANQRVLPIPRQPARLDLVELAREADTDSAADLLDSWTRTFLRVPLHPTRLEAIREFARTELGGDELDLDAVGVERERLETALRRIIHLLLSTPEYQLG